MDNILYRLMNWPEIESIVYSECDHPHDILGKHSEGPGNLFQCFFPGAKSVMLKNTSTGQGHSMEMADEAGFFACWMIGKEPVNYEYIVEYDEGNALVKKECYKELPSVSDEDLDKFKAGILYDSYRFFGSHVRTINKVNGVSFSLYAPGAQRVSVVGDFNNWDGRVNQMSRIKNSDIFSIFIPGISEGALYKFEIKLPSGLTYLKRDPYTFKIEDGRGDASVVKDVFSREEADSHFDGLNDNFECALKVDLSSFINCSVDEMSQRLLEASRVIASDTVIFEDFSMYHDKDVSNEMTLSLYSINEDIISVCSLKALIKKLHRAGLKVIFSYDPSSFFDDNDGLKGFCGTDLYEKDDYSIFKKLTFDFSSKYVRNYLISVAFFFVEVFKADGIRVENLDRILYLDYERPDEDFIPNIYGGNENLGGFEFIKHLNSILHKNYPFMCTIADGSLNSNNLTDSLLKDGFGFDLKLNNSIVDESLEFLKKNYEDRRAFYNDIVNVGLDPFMERFMISMSHDFSFDGISRAKETKYLKLLLACLMLRPEKKCFDYSFLLNAKVNDLLRDFVELYKRHPFLQDKAFDYNCFKWLDQVDREHISISFMRMNEEKRIVISANFSDKDITVSLNLDKEGSFADEFSDDKSKTYNTVKDKRRDGNYKLSYKVKADSVTVLSSL